MLDQWLESHQVVFVSYQARHELSKALRIASQGLAVAPRSVQLLEARAVIYLQVGGCPIAVDHSG